MKRVGPNSTPPSKGGHGGTRTTWKFLMVIAKRLPDFHLAPTNGPKRRSRPSPNNIATFHAGNESPESHGPQNPPLHPLGLVVGGPRLDWGKDLPRGAPRG